MTIKPDSQSHPECEEDEIYLGNFTVEDFAKLGYETKRMGNTPYDIYGSRMYNTDLYPVFVKIAVLKPATNIRLHYYDWQLKTEAKQ